MSHQNGAVRLTPWVDEPTWGVLRSRVCAWLLARNQGMRVVLGYGAGAVFRRQAQWLGLDWDDEATTASGLRDEALTVCLHMIASGKARKTAFYIGEIAWYGAEMVDVSCLTWEDVLGGPTAVDPGDGWRLYRALLPDFGGGGPSGEFTNLLADRAAGVTHICLAAQETVATARYGAIARAMGWPLPTFAHLPPIEGDRPVGLRRLMTRDAQAGHIAARVAESLRLPPAGTLRELVPAFDLGRLKSDPAGFDPSPQMGFNHDS